MEHERKFLLKRLPDDFDTYTKEDVTQWYIKTYKSYSLRLRLYSDGRCYLDIKERKSGISKRKSGKKAEFINYQKFTENKPFIKKVRYKKHYKNHLVIIDVFDDNLMIIEVESKDINYLKSIIIPDWFGIEVTDDIRYTNHHMSLCRQN